MDLSTIFQAFLPCIVVLVVGLLALLVMRFAPDWLTDFLNFNFTNPKANAKRKRK